MRHDRFGPYRRRVVAEARGRVLEIGIGSGINLPLYSAGVRRVIGLDPSPALLARARAAAIRAGDALTLLDASAEAIPLENGSVDTVVTTWTLCSIPDAAQALHEVRRVLADGGTLLFVEHGRSPDTSIARWQDRLTPLWKRAAGGCHLNRPIDRLIEASGFRIERLDTDYMTGPKLMTFMYEGAARPA